MPFVKVVKSPQYFSRFQVKYRRRRDCKTDYQQRRRLILQDKNKYNTPKYRFVVRSSNKFITCQVIYAKVIGDVTICSASSRELPRYGVSVGLTNYSAAYCTGLLCARRLLSSVGLASQYVGQTPKDLGKAYIVGAAEEGPRPFKAFLDLGLVRTVTGAKVFVAMKGACDGGLNIPHTNKKLRGFIKGKYDAKKARGFILGSHVAAYMKLLEGEDEETYKKRFSRYIKAGITHKTLDKMYLDCHAAIRKDPSRPKKEERRDYPVVVKAKRMSLQQKRDRIKMRILAAQKKGLIS